MLSSKTVLLAITCFTLSSCAAPISILRREVPQEKSHQRVLDAVQTSLQKDNVENFIDPVFGLLGNAAAAQGLGTTTDATCLQQAMADRAFTNAKAAGDVDGQVQALIYRALERNSGSVGGVTDPCTSVQAVNPEIAAIQQHQDPASQNADQVNKAIELELAKQIASVGGDPLLALDSATFPPGEIGDATAKGKSCDDANCIFDLNLLTPIATQDEILAAVGGGAGGNAGGNGTNTGANGGANGGAAGNGSNNGNTGGATGNAGNGTNNGNAGGAAGNTGANTGNNGGAADTGAGNAGASGNLQTFTGALGGTAPAVTPGGRGFQVEGSDDFLNVGAALGRSCDIQHNQCANAANSGGGFSVGDCDQQNNDCRAAAQNGWVL
ncbi:hypothetical protein V5O48_000989 [Marasmius crinis-equi]|uniref:Uncharacterized protein n=1 Tax=Marasmius crinis-equi TaxID=585013 RepID=A0ABR3G096_9AGAR